MVWFINNNEAFHLQEEECVISCFKSYIYLTFGERLWLRSCSRLSTKQKIGGSVPGSTSPHVELPLGKIPQIAPNGFNAISVWMCECNMWQELRVNEGLEQHYITTVHLPFIDFFLVTLAWQVVMTVLTYVYMAKMLANSIIFTHPAAMEQH